MPTASMSTNVSKRNMDEKSKIKDSSWQQHVLQSLVERAVPEPIKVACIAVPPGKPSWLGEEYHGNISKAELNRLLSGKYRYLVRDSTSSPGDYSISVNFDGEIMHYKLLYDGKHYKTELCDTEHYKTITELMVYILNLCKSMKKMADNTKKKYQKPHDFTKHNFMHPKWCDVCGGFLWGLWKQGMKCEDCGSCLHKSCIDKCTQPCEKIVLGHKIAKGSFSTAPQASDSSSTRGSRYDSTRSSSASELSNNSPLNNSPLRHQSSSGSNMTRSVMPTCEYFQECMKFISSRVGNSYIDFESPLTQCYCETCFKYDSSSKTRMWCRFPMKQGLSQGEMDSSYMKAYYAVFPAIVKDTLDDLDSGEFYKRLGKDELVVVPSVQSVGESERYDYVHIVLEVYVEPNSYVVQQHEANSSTEQVECWVLDRERHIIPNALLIKALGFLNGSTD